MKNKKAQWGILVGILIFLVIIFLAIAGILYLKNKGYFNNSEQENQSNPITLLLACKDYKTMNYINAKYILEYNNEIASQGNVSKDFFIPVVSKDQEMYHLYCWSEKYYTTQLIEDITKAEQYPCPIGNYSEYCERMETSTAKIGNLSIYVKGEINQTQEINNLVFILSSDGVYKDIGICTKWTTGIIYAFPKDNLIKCSEWVNWSKYDIYTGQYEYYPENITRCKEDNRTYKCEKILDNTCIKYPNLISPSWLKGKTERCYNLKTGLDNSTLEIPFEVKILKDDLKEWDELILYVLDRDLRKVDGNWTYVYEFNGEDAGDKTKNFTLKPVL